MSGLSLVLSHTSHETSATLFLLLSDKCDTLASSSVWAVPCEGKLVSWGLTPPGTDKGQSSAGGLLLPTEPMTLPPLFMVTSLRDPLP